MNELMNKISNHDSWINNTENIDWAFKVLVETTFEFLNHLTKIRIKDLQFDYEFIRIILNSTLFLLIKFG